MAKPFSIQAPEDIAKEYAGNKQKIAQAAQMGVVDPTAAVLAGMFIDRMRSAQVMEAAQQPTVAQQVLGGQPQMAPMGAPPAPPPMGAPPAPPPMAPPPQDMGMAPPPQGMAAGGLAALPVPDAMFDEPTNGGYDDGYAGGGMVAFADGGSTGGMGDYIEQMVRKIDPNIQIAGRARTPARNAEVGGVAGSYHLINAARDVSVPPGMAKPQFIAQLKSVFGPDYDILPSKGNSVHIEPGPKLGEKVRAGARSGNAPTILPERDFGTAEGRASSVTDEYQNLMRQFGPTEKQREVEAKRLARAEEMASDEYYEKQRKDSMYQTLAEIGFNMASSKSPYLLQAVGEAAAAAMPGARADKKERKALKDRALDIMGQMNDKTRRENLEVLGVAVDMANTGLKASQFNQELALREGELDAREAEAAKKSPEEQLIDTYYQQFLKSGDAPARAYQKAMFAAKNLLERAKPKDGTSAQTNEDKLKAITGQDGGAGEFKYLGTEG